MGDKTWKREERRVARDIGTERNWKGTSGDIPDVKDEFLSVEVKNQKAVPKFLYKVLDQAESHCGENRIPMAVVRKKYQNKRIAIIEWEKFLKIYNKYKEKKNPDE